MMSLLRMFTAVAFLAAPAGAAEKSFSLFPELMGAPQTMAAAFDINEAELTFDYAQLKCFERYDRDGAPVTDADQLKACQEAVDALYGITTNGYCRDDKNGTWRTCQFTDD